MPLRIACDLDGTVADMDGALQQHAEALFGPGVDVRFNVGAQRELPIDGEAAEAADGAESEASSASVRAPGIGAGP